MSLYRQAGRSRTPIVVLGVVCVLAGALVGFFVGRESAPEPTLAEQIADAREQARPALSSLELVGIEYSEAVAPNGQVTAETEYEAAVDHAAAAAQALQDAGSLRELDPRALDHAVATVADVEQAVAGLESPAVVNTAVSRARSAVEILVDPAGATSSG